MHTLALQHLKRAIRRKQAKHREHRPGARARAANKSGGVKVSHQTRCQDAATSAMPSIPPVLSAARAAQRTIPWLHCCDPASAAILQVRLRYKRLWRCCVIQDREVLSDRSSCPVHQARGRRPKRNNRTRPGSRVMCHRQHLSNNSGATTVTHLRQWHHAKLQQPPQAVRRVAAQAVPGWAASYPVPCTPLPKQVGTAVNAAYLNLAYKRQCSAIIQ
jgi:hypothetical protein